MGKQAADPPVLEVRELVRSYGEIGVLNGVDFRLKAGQALAVVGENGSGKSTLLRCLVGLEAPDSGQVLLHGEPVAEEDPAFRADVAYVLDGVDFFPDLSVYEHLDLFGRAHGQADTETLVPSLLRELELEDERDRLPITLSQGQRRRLGLASCLVRPRRLLILDEPEHRLDQAGRDWLGSRLVAEKQAGCAIVIASHDPAIVRRVADLELTL